jgi:hypothetical protein
MTMMSLLSAKHPSGPRTHVSVLPDITTGIRPGSFPFYRTDVVLRPVRTLNTPRRIKDEECALQQP